MSQGMVAIKIRYHVTISISLIEVREHLYLTKCFGLSHKAHAPASIKNAKLRVFWCCVYESSKRYIS